MGLPVTIAVFLKVDELYSSASEIWLESKEGTGKRHPNLSHEEAETCLSLTV
jgi:hypothetical protein